MKSFQKLLSLAGISSAFISTSVESFSSRYTESPVSVLPETTDKRNNTPLNCPHFQNCPGCITPIDYTNVPVVESAKLFFSSSSIQQKTINPRENFFETVIPSSVHGWRTQAKLAVKPKSKWGAGCKFGLYERSSHELVEIPSCAVHHPSINEAIAILEKATINVKTPSWNEDSGSNGLRYVQLSVERITGRVSMTLIWHAGDLKQTQPHLSRLIKECKKIDNERKKDNEPSLFHSIWCHTNDSLGNAIFARGQKNWHPMDGPEFVREVLPGTNVKDREGLLFFSPMVFRQGNLNGFDEIALHVANSVGGGNKVCELYAGVGLLGFTALSYWERQGEPLGWVRCSDENPNNPRCFKKTLNSIPSDVSGRLSMKSNNKKKAGYNFKKKGNDQNQEKTLDELMQEMMDGGVSESTVVDPRKGKISYVVADAASALHKGEALGADVLIVDPPRKGLDDEVLTQLCKPYNPKQSYTEDPMFLDVPKYATNWVNDVHTLVYVSCGFDALARDCDRLLKGNAGWKLESATGYILFPGSNHVETVAIFKRRAGRDDYDLQY